jgi:A/G-specific adenine glycosylase
MDFTEKLVGWYDKNRRELPWRETLDPYRIWLSEILLQQTRIDQGLPYYHRFVETFPSVQELAGADEQQVLRLWQGLGYYTRARNLHATAREIVSAHGGRFPEKYEEIKKLRGIGEYTAAAIASISFSLPFPVVDGNVIRFFSRHFGIEVPASSALMKNTVRRIAGQLILKTDPGRFNQAMMEFGALCCRPSNPLCKTCIFRRSCVARREGRVDLLPVRAEKSEKRIRYFHYLLIFPKDKRSLYLKKRVEDDIWKSLYDFPLIETPEGLTEPDLKKNPQWKKLFRGVRIRRVSVSPPFTHRLTHLVLIARFVRVETDPFPELPFERTVIRDLEKYPLPRLIERYLMDHPLNIREEA